MIEMVVVLAENEAVAQQPCNTGGLFKNITSVAVNIDVYGLPEQDMH